MALPVAVAFGALLLAVATSTASNVAPVFQLGQTAQLQVFADGSYTVGLARANDTLTYDIWLESGDTALYCNGQWHSAAAGSLTLQSSGASSGASTRLGPFDGYTFRWVAKDAVGMTAFETSFLYFTEYDFFVFEQRFPNGADNTLVNQTVVGYEFGSASLPMARFPSFVDSPSVMLEQLGTLVWQSRFAYDYVHWNVGLKQFRGGEEAGPLVLFDARPPPAPQRPRALVYSSFDNFKQAITSPPVQVAGAEVSIGSGISGRVASLPAGFTVSFCMYASSGGINDAMNEWGRRMQLQYATTRIKPDVVNDKLGYWTDNGAIYSCGYWSEWTPGKPTAQDILIRLKQKLDEQRVPIQYIQLDPWWYIIYDPDGATYEWAPVPNLFPNGLAVIRNATGIPFLLYSAFFDRNNSYLQQYRFEDSFDIDLSWFQGYLAQVDPSQSFAFYDQLFTLSTPWGFGAFEVDFMDFNYLTIPGFTSTLNASENWIAGFASAAAKHDVSVQLCMGLPSDFMVALSNPAITNVRASEDNFPGTGGWFIGHTSILISALGLGPFKDNFWTNSTQPDNTYGTVDHNPELQTVVSIFSAGPVGISDSIGSTNAELIMRTCTADGTLLKPSKSATSFDTYFQIDVWPDWQSHVQHTHSLISDGNGGTSTFYELLFINMYWNFTVMPHHVWPPLDGDVKYVWFTWGDKACIPGSPAPTCIRPFSEDAGILASTAPMNATHIPFDIKVVVPVLDNNWILLGEPTKYVTASPVRLSKVAVTNTGLSIWLAGSPGEQLEIIAVTPGLDIRGQPVEIEADGTAYIVFSA